MTSPAKPNVATSSQRRRRFGCQPIQADAPARSGGSTGALASRQMYRPKIATSTAASTRVSELRSGRVSE